MTNGHGNRRPGGYCVAVVLALVLAALPVLPAAADHSPPPGSPVAGSGSLEGTELVEEQTFLGQPCFAATRIVFGLGGVGTYQGRTAGGQEVVYRAEAGQGQAVHQGPLRVEIENTQPFHHGPKGTHGGDSSCSDATAGTPVPAQFRIFAAGHVYRLDGTGAQAPCVGHGSWVRTGGWESENWHADWTLDEDCVVVGNEAGTPGQGIAPARTAHTHRGLHMPCGGGCVDNLKADYTEHLPVPGLAVGLGGASSAHIGDTVTVTAGVADDGAPLPGAAVTFSVAGPSPTAPAGGTGATDANGRASFTFGAGVVGDYTVTASATSAAYPGRVVSATHTVRFSPRPPPSMTLAGPPTAQTGDGVTVTASVVNEGDPANPAGGVAVDFAVNGAGQATPASGTAVTDANGWASFTFSGDRAGDYTVTASATHLGQEMSATHGVHLVVRTMQRVGAITLPPDEAMLTSAVIDPAGNFAYFGENEGAESAKVVKVDLDTFQRVGALTLGADERLLTSAVIDPAGNYAYFASGGWPGPGRVVKIDLRTFQRVGSITLAEGEYELKAAVIDPAGAYAYFGTHTAPGRVVKVDLATFQRVGALILPEENNGLTSAVIDPAGAYAYFGAFDFPGRVVKVDLATFQRVGAITLAEGEDDLTSAAVIDPAGRFAYFSTNWPMKVVKVDLATFQRVGAITVPVENGLSSAVVDPAGAYAYFGTLYNDATGAILFPRPGVAPPRPEQVVKVDLNSFSVVTVLTLAGDGALTSAVMAPDSSHAYFGTSPNPGPAAGTDDDPPTKVVKVSLTRPPAPWLVAAGDSYTTNYGTPLTVPAPGVLANDADTADGDPLVAGQAGDPPHGTVALNPDGSFTYTPDNGFSGADTFTYTASDGMDYSAPATVNLSVGAPPEGVSAVKGSAYGYYSNVSLFGGPSSERGPAGTTNCDATSTTACSPSVNLAPTGGNQSGTDPDGAVAQYGPAVIFESSALGASTQGSTGPSGSVTSSTSASGVQPGPFTADSTASTCTASATGTSASTTIANGQLVTKTDSNGDPVTTVAIPANPPPNDTYYGTLDHVGDSFKAVFNEQTRNPDGSITVVAYHAYLLGPTAVGDLIVGQAVCGVTTNATPPQRTVSISPASVSEGTAARGFTVMKFAVTLSKRSTQVVTVMVNTSDGTARAQGDYKSRTMTVKIPAGKVRAVFKVNVVRDAIDEDNETLSATLSSPTNAGIGTATAVGTIIDDD